MYINLSISLSDKQKEILDWCKIGNGIQYVVVSTGRQVGKTTIAQVVALDWVFEHDGFDVGIFLPTYKQAKNLFRRYKKMLKELEDDSVVSFKGAPDFLLTFSNKSTIHFFTADNDSCRGETFDAIIVDEACFVKDAIWAEAIEPTVAVSLSKEDIFGDEGFFGKVLLTSTPKKKNYFYDWTKNEEDNVVVTKFTSEEGGIISKKVIESIKKRIPESSFRNEYLGEFLDAGTGMFKYKDCLLPKDKPFGKGVVAGLDLGSKEDWTVLTIQDSKGEVVYMNRWRHQEWTSILEAVKVELLNHGKPTCYVETNGIGQMPFEVLRQKYGKVKEWVTTNKSKNDIIQALILAFNTGDILIPDIDYLKDELDAFTCEWKNGKAVYGGSNGFHDDSVMSLAICNHHRKKVKKVKATIMRKSKSIGI